jgi:Skp family chaperone for outer membrane proteins
MKKFGFFAAAVLFALLLGISAFAQAPAQPAPTKIGWIDTGVFNDEKDGIVKYVNAYKALANEAKPRETELMGLQTKIQTIQADLQKMADNSKVVPIDEKAALAKKDEGERLAREFDFKKKEYDAFVQKRGGEIIGPLNADIGKAIADFGKSKGYVVIFDIQKLDQAGAILHLEPTANITKEFITFYNARTPAATAATTPK